MPRMVTRHRCAVFSEVVLPAIRLAGSTLDIYVPHSFASRVGCWWVELDEREREWLLVIPFENQKRCSR